MRLQPLDGRSYPVAKDAAVTNAKCVLGVWFCKFVVLYLQSFVVCLCGGVDNESRAGPSNEWVSVDVDFEVV